RLTSPSGAAPSASWAAPRSPARRRAWAVAPSPPRAAPPAPGGTPGSPLRAPPPRFAHFVCAARQWQDHARIASAAFRTGGRGGPARPRPAAGGGDRGAIPAQGGQGGWGPGLEAKDVLQDDEPQPPIGRGAVVYATRSGAKHHAENCAS